MVKFRRKRLKDAADIPKDWDLHYINLWTEDDVNYPGKETISKAFQRITGLSDKGVDRFIEKEDNGDWLAYFYQDGWVKIISYEGGQIGVLIEEHI